MGLTTVGRESTTYIKILKENKAIAICTEAWAWEGNDIIFLFVIPFKREDRFRIITQRKEDRLRSWKQDGCSRLLTLRAISDFCPLGRASLIAHCYATAVSMVIGPLDCNSGQPVLLLVLGYYTETPHCTPQSSWIPTLSIAHQPLLQWLPSYISHPRTYHTHSVLNSRPHFSDDFFQISWCLQISITPLENKLYDHLILHQLPLP